MKLCPVIIVKHSLLHSSFLSWPHVIKYIVYVIKYIVYVIKYIVYSTCLTDVENAQPL